MSFVEFRCVYWLNEFSYLNDKYKTNKFISVTLHNRMSSWFVCRSVAPLEDNFVCAESDDLLGNSVFKMESGSTGHRFTEICLQQVAKDFRGDQWIHNGPHRITEGLLELCNVQKVIIL